MKNLNRYNETKNGTEVLEHSAECLLKGNFRKGELYITNENVYYIGRKEELVFNKANSIVHIKKGMMFVTVTITAGGAKKVFEQVDKKQFYADNTDGVVENAKKEVKVTPNVKEEVKPKKKSKFLKYTMYGFAGLIAFSLIFPDAKTDENELKYVSPTKEVKVVEKKVEPKIEKIIEKKEVKKDITKEWNYRTFTRVNDWLKKNKKTSLVDFQGKPVVYRDGYVQGEINKVTISFYGMIVNPATNSMIPLKDYEDAIVSIYAGISGSSYSVAKGIILSATKQFNNNQGREFNVGKNNIRLNRDSGNGLIEFTFTCNWANY